MRALNLLRRALVAYQIWSIRVTIAGQGEVLDCVIDPMLAGRIQIARHHARRELARLLVRQENLRSPRQWRLT